MSKIMREHVARKLEQLQALSLGESLRLLAESYQGKVAFYTQFNDEDQVITHEILSKALPIHIFTVDTGLLSPEVYRLWDSTNKYYNTIVRAYYPDTALLEQHVSKYGPSGRLESAESKQDHHYVREVEPLQRALKGSVVGITGNRDTTIQLNHKQPTMEWDEANQRIQFHPLLHWSAEAVQGFLTQHQVPSNYLHSVTHTFPEGDAQPAPEEQRFILSAVKRDLYNLKVG